MAYLALYRAWRPQTFGDVVGQEHITQTLKNALKGNRYSHAYLFSGPRGTGKTSIAKIFAKALNCEVGVDGEPCNQCFSCKGIVEGSIMDVVEIDAASNRGVEEIRELREKIKFVPTEVSNKVYIIDEVHMLTTEAFNALLKTLEEPPEHVVFILATTEPHKLPLTIISRCQRFDFKRVASESMIARLKQIVREEGYQIEQEALSVIARHAEGGMRDALSLLDQVLSNSKETVSFNDVLRITGRASRSAFSQITRNIHNNEVAKVLQVLADLIQDGKDPERLLEDLLYYYRDLLLYKSAPNIDESLEKVHNEPSFEEIANLYSFEQIYQVMEILNKYLKEIKSTNQTRLILELAILRIAKLPEATEPIDQVMQHTPDGDIEILKLRIAELESKVAQLTQEPIFSKKSSEQNNDKKPTTIIQGLNDSRVISKLEQLSERFSEVNLQNLKQQWGKILQTVKNKRVTVHAWLIDGEPVAAASNIVIIAFNNLMHRETTEKAGNRQLIEEVISELLGNSYNIYTVMQKDWLTFLEQHQNTNESNDQVPKVETENKEEDFITTAIELFGEEIVVIKD